MDIGDTWRSLRLSAVTTTLPGSRHAHVALRRLLGYFAVLDEPRQPLAVLQLGFCLDQEITGIPGVLCTAVEGAGSGLMLGFNPVRQIGQGFGTLELIIASHGSPPLVREAISTANSFCNLCMSSIVSLGSSLTMVSKRRGVFDDARLDGIGFGWQLHVGGKVVEHKPSSLELSAANSASERPASWRSYSSRPGW